MRLRGLIVSLFFLSAPLIQAAAPWTSDLGNGRYRNPVLFLDYSDPDVVRVGADFYLVSSSFECVPGLPVLHSRDLVNWEFSGYALQQLVPAEDFSVPHHGEGVWAPSIRFHDGKFWIYYPDPDYGIYLVTAADPRGPWSDPVLVDPGKGLIDPCPLWDDDGQVYLVHAWARSRGPVANRLTVERLTADGLRAADPGRDVIDGNAMPGWTTIEGPKFYKRNGYYYIFCPAGGVTHGYQAVFRAKSVFGPYENRIVLSQGTTAVNGPHQGAWVDTAAGEDWFLHFQDRDAYGRVVHLEPMVWRPDNWPVIGSDPKHTGTGSPVAEFAKPATPGPVAVSRLPTSDDFQGPELGRQWQWNANPQSSWMSLSENPGHLRLHVVATDPKSLVPAGNLLLQKFPGPRFTATTSLDLSGAKVGDEAGLIVFGHDYSWLGLRRTAAGIRLVRGTFLGNSSYHAETEDARPESFPPKILLRMTATAEPVCQFSWSRDGVRFLPMGEPFRATAGRWIGAKVGVFAARPQPSRDPLGEADFDWFRVDAMIP